jgi:L-threonine kinase
MKIKVRIPGTCGELVQGRIEGKDSHITCPVEILSSVSVQLTQFYGQIECPPDKVKTRQAVRKTLELLGHTTRGVKVSVSSQIHVGKGMASSTADIVGGCLATAKALGKTISPRMVADIAISIEPTDGIMYEGIVCFDHLGGEIIQSLGDAPPIDILVIDPGGSIDTLRFDSRRERCASIYIKNENFILEALSLVKEGIKKRDIHLVGKGATLSALRNQEILYKRELADIISISTSLGGIGVNVAHSGTVIGILLPPDFSQNELLKKRIRERCGNHMLFYQTRLIGGGQY